VTVVVVVEGGEEEGGVEEEEEIQTIQNTVNTSTHITKTMTQLSKHPHVAKLVKTPTVQDTHQMKYTQYNQVPSV